MRQATISSADFMRVFAREARAGKSALEIGQVLGLQGDTGKIATYVSVKASQLRKRLGEAALAKAKAEGLSPEATDALVKATTDKLPRLRMRGRPAGTTDLMSALDGILAELDAAVVEPEVSEPEVSEPEVSEPEVSKPKRGKRGS